jgi:hypothetical protein
MDAKTYTIEEQKANRKRWVEALRGGEYQQGRNGILKELDGRMCCLAVACEISGLGQWVPVPGICEDYAVSSYVSRGAVPIPVMAWLGLRDDNGHFDTSIDGVTHLSSLNDNGTSFRAIADIIESEPPGLFVDADLSVSP